MQKLKTDNLCCPRIGQGYIKDGNTYDESIAAEAAAGIACDWNQRNRPQGPILISIQHYVRIVSQGKYLIKHYPLFTWTRRHFRLHKHKNKVRQKNWKRASFWEMIYLHLYQCGSTLGQVSKCCAYISVNRRFPKRTKKWPFWLILISICKHFLVSLRNQLYDEIHKNLNL